MDEQTQNKPMEASKPKASCSTKDSCWCQAIGAILIIVLVWLWTPAWANIAITVIAGLMILGSFGMCCRKPKK